MENILNLWICAEPHKNSPPCPPGWRIMPEDESLNLRMNKDILNQVLERIRWGNHHAPSLPYCPLLSIAPLPRDLQYTGEPVPEIITLKLQ